MSSRNGTLEFAAQPAMSRVGREFTRTMLARWGVAGPRIDVACLLVSEIVTNAIVATAQDAGTSRRDSRAFTYWQRLERAIEQGVASSAGSPHGARRYRWEPTPEEGLVRAAQARVSLRLSAPEDRLLVEVGDMISRPPLLQAADPQSEGGRGIALVDRLSDEWGWYWTEGTGKIVWCSLTLG